MRYIKRDWANDIAPDSVQDEDVQWGYGSLEVAANDIPFDNSGTGINSTNVDDVVKEIDDYIDSNSRVLYVDGQREDTYTETGSILRPFKTIPSALTYIENDVQDRISDGETRTDCRYVIELRPSTYSEDLNIPSVAALQFNMAGGEISGNITKQASQTGYDGDYYSKLVFKGFGSKRAEKGRQSVISGNFTTSTEEGTNYLYYITMSGIEFAGDFTANNGVCVLNLRHSALYDDTKTITGTGAILIESTDGTRIKSNISGDVSFYNVINTEISGDINTSPSNPSRFIATEFGDNVTISSQDINVDPLSHRNLNGVSSLDLTGATLVLDHSIDAIENNSTVDGNSASDALEHLDTNKAELVGSQDIEITDNSAGVILQSNDGSRWRITVNNDGSLTTNSI